MSIRRNFALSILVHAAFVCLLLLLRHWFPPSVLESEKKWTWVDLQPPAKTQTALKKEEKAKSQRIVQTDLAQKTDQTAPDAFLGKQTQAVDRQMVSKNSDLGKVGSTKKAQNAVPIPKSGGVETAEKKAERPTERKLDLSKFGLPLLPAPGAGNHVPEDRKPQPLNQEQDAGDVAPHEYVKGLQEGEKTLLNTKEFVFFGYYQRIRDRLEMNWGPLLRSYISRMYDNGRSLASDSEHVTRLLVTLNAKGEIVRVQMMEESGVKDLDDAAVGAFNQAGPFPNPPKGILDADGKVHLRWDFVLRT